MTRIPIFLFLLLAMLSALCAPTSAQTCSVPSFTQAPVYPVGSDIRSVATADFDSDGRPDLAVADAASSTVAVLLKVGRGTPAIINTYAVGAFPLSVVTGDFTGDGKPDIISTSNSSGTVSLLRNNGFGGFVVGTPPGGGGGVDMAVGDFNNNGTLDVAFASEFNVTILLGNGQGGFSAPTFFQASANKIIAADFNNDGKLDLATVGSSTTQIYLGNGAGQFAAAQCSLQSASGGLAAGDVNGDGKLDLVRANILSADIQIHLGNGAGCLAGSTADIDVLNFGRPGFVAVRDLNKDGKLDIVAGATVLLGNGSGAFGPPFAFGMGSLGADPGANTVVADFDGDSNLDIASASTGSAGILFGDGAGGFRLAVGPAGRGVFGLARADLNNDGKQDVVGMSNGGFAIMLGDGTGNLGTPSNVTVPGGSFDGLVIADFNGDTKLDIAGFDNSHTGPGGLPRFQVVLGDGLGGFGSTVSTSFNDFQPAALAGGDLNADGRIDLITVNRAGGNNNGGSISIGIGIGDGHFVMQPNVSVATATNPVGAAFADFNNDGKMDLAIPSGGSFSILLGNGAGGFASVTQIATAHSNSIRAADLNGDGKADLAMSSQEQNGKTSVVFGDGTGGFTAPLQFSLGSFPSDLTVADFNNDGKPDLAVSISRQDPFPSPGKSNIVVLFGDGIGGFGPPVTIPAERSASRIIAADLTGDARPEIITANQLVNNLTVALNTCGSPPPTTFTISGAVTDANSQGIAEVAMILVSDVAEPQVSLTDGNGNYAFTYAGNLSHNLRVTPSKAGYSFSPLEMVFVSSSTVNGDKTASFTGTPSSTPPPGQIPILLTREDSQHALALDSVTFTSDPFAITNIHNFSPDQRTRITLFAVNVELGPGETTSVIEAQAEDAGQTFPLTVEHFTAVPNFTWLKQVTVKLPDALAGKAQIDVTLKVRGTSGNTVIVKLTP